MTNHHTMIHIHTDFGDECGWHFEWKGGDACTVRIVDSIWDTDVDVFNMAEPSTTDEVVAACQRWSERVSA